MKIAILLAGSRAGSDFFASLLDGHSQICQFPGDFVYDKKLKEIFNLDPNQIPDEFIKVSESGISSSETIIDLKTYGYKGFLVGENFMKTDNPGKSAFEFIKKIENEI